MSGFDLWKLLLKRSLRLIWVCGVFALLFAVVFFVGFVKSDMLSGLYRDIIKGVESEYVVMQCDYSPETDIKNAEVGIYYSQSGVTYDVVISGGSGDISVDRYSRGLNICVVLPAWQRYIAGQPLKTGENGIWLYRAYATQAGISVGDTVTVTTAAGDAVKSYRVAGTYTTDIVSYLKSGFTPSFLIAAGEERASASLVCAAEQVYSVFLSDLRKTVMEDDGMMELCEGYYLAGAVFNALFCLFAVAAVLLQIKMINFMQSHLARQSFLLSVLGLSKFRQWMFDTSVLLVFGFISLGAGIGIFYIFVAVTEALSSSIMGMVFGEISIGLSVLFGYIVYFGVSALTTLFRLSGKSLERGGL